MARRNKKVLNIRNGISLTELLVAVSIIGILASIATLRFENSIECTQLQNAADRLMTDLRLVRDQARSEQQPYTLSLNVGARSYQAPGVLNLKRSADIAVGLTDAPYYLTEMSSTLTADSVTFNDQGSPSKSGNITLKLGSKNTTIKIDKNGQIEQEN